MQRASFFDIVNIVALFIYLFFIYNALTISWYGTHNRARLQIKCALGGDDSPQHRHWSTLIDKCVGSFKSPDRTSRGKTNGLTSLSTDGVAKEGRLKFNPRPGGVLNPEPSAWPSEILLTVPTSHTLILLVT